MSSITLEAPERLPVDGTFVIILNIQTFYENDEDNFIFKLHSNIAVSPVHITKERPTITGPFLCTSLRKGLQ